MNISSVSTVRKITVERAYMEGRMPRRTSLYIRVERVLIPAPFVKCVIIKSSKDMVKASKNPDRTPGRISGKTTLKKADTGPAPKSIAAS